MDWLSIICSLECKCIYAQKPTTELNVAIFPVYQFYQNEFHKTSWSMPKHTHAYTRIRSCSHRWNSIRVLAINIRLPFPAVISIEIIKTYSIRERNMHVNMKSDSLTFEMGGLNAVLACVRTTLLLYYSVYVMIIIIIYRM